MKIAYIVDGDPTNKRLWSGTVSYIYQSLCKVAEVECIDISGQSKLLTLWYRLLSAVIKLFSGKKFYASFGLIKAKRDSKIVTRFLRGRDDIDYVFCAAKSGSIAFVKTDRKIIYLTDATFDGMHGYYGYLTGLCSLTVKNANRIEKGAIDNSELIICPSEWVRASVCSTYGKAEEKTVLIPFGANIDEAPTPSSGGDGEFNILFCGVEWERKGGDVAVDAFRHLRRSHPECKLYLVGCKPPYEITDEGIELVGFLNKNNPEEKKRLADIYASTSLLLLPTRAEAAGIVFAEASAHGIPSLTYNTGGVGAYVIDGENGYKLSTSACAEDFADKIVQIIEDGELYGRLQRRSRELFFERYNWSAWLDSFLAALENMK